MKVYQNETTTVNNELQLFDPKTIATKASEGLLSLSIEIGLDVLQQIMNGEVAEYAGAKGKHIKVTCTP
jgi:hypothetical protein